MKVTNDIDQDFTRDFNQDFNQDFAQDSDQDIEQELDQNYGQEENNRLQKEREVDTSESDLSAEENFENQRTATRNQQDNRVEYDIARTRASHKSCVVCQKKCRLKRVSNRAILNAFLHTNILIPFGCRICKHHFDELGLIKPEALYNLRAFKQSIRLKKDEVSLLIEIYQLAALRNTLKS